MLSQVQQFKNLHLQNEPLILGNVWNVQSAKILEKVGYEAVGTSSAAIAQTLGYEDGENISFSDYLFIIKRIIYSTKVPVTVDLEAGFGQSADVVIDNICQLYDLGVAGLNIEDSVVQNSIRTLVDENSFTRKLEKITNALASKNIDMFLNIRCDPFLLKATNKLEESLRRIQSYAKTNINGIFLPCITDENDIKEVVKNINLPLNVLCMPGLASFDKLKELGVKRISMGSSVNSATYKKMEEICSHILEQNNFSSVFE